MLKKAMFRKGFNLYSFLLQTVIRQKPPAFTVSDQDVAGMTAPARIAPFRLFSEVPPFNPQINIALKSKCAETLG